MNRLEVLRLLLDLLKRVGHGEVWVTQYKLVQEIQEQIELEESTRVDRNKNAAFEIEGEPPHVKTEGCTFGSGGKESATAKPTESIVANMGTFIGGIAPEWTRSSKTIPMSVAERDSLIQEACQKIGIVFYSRSDFIQACLKGLAKGWSSVQVTYHRDRWSVLCFDGDRHQLRGASDDLAAAMAEAVLKPMESQEGRA